MTLTRLPDGSVAFVCGPTRLICDVCDARVLKKAPKFPWRGRQVDLCPNCRSRYEADEPGFRAFADKTIATYYKEKAAP